MEMLHSTPAHEALRAFQGAGGVVEHFLFVNPGSSDLTPHRAVARASLQTLQERFPGGRNQFKMQIDWDCFAQNIPCLVSSQEFLRLDYEEQGYAYSVLFPPYTLRGTDAEKQALLDRLCLALFGDLETLEIYAWPTDCSNFFDLGKQWWGTFFWTVYSPTYNWYVGILASSTD